MTAISADWDKIPAGFAGSFVAKEASAKLADVLATVSWSFSNDSVATPILEAVESHGNCCHLVELIGNRPGTVVLSARMREVNSAPMTVTVTPREQWATVSAAEHTCGTTVSGLPSCWDNDPGEIYTGEVPRVTVPFMPPFGYPRMKAWGGICGITLDNAWVCLSSHPLILDTLAKGTSFRSLSVGFSECALSDAGAAYCRSRISPLRPPSVVQTSAPFASLSVAGSHSCAIVSNGKAYCWGQANWFGNLGTASPSSSCVSVPCEVTGGLTFKVITVGDGISCGVVSVGESYCWGSAKAPWRAGLGGVNSTPSRVENDPGFVTLAAASDHVCGLTITGDAYCWGMNDRGQLGIGFISPATAAPLGPQLVAGNRKFKSISTSTALSCGLTTDGEIYCWGNVTKIGDRTVFWLDPDTWHVDGRDGHILPDVPTPRRVGG